MNAIEAAAVVLVLAIFGFVSYKKRCLDSSGVLVGILVGAAIYLLGGIQAFAAIVVLFIAAEVCTRVGRKNFSEKHAARTTGNILGNSVAAIIALLLGQPFAFYGAISAALADTASSEIGMLSKKKPRLITSFEVVEPGTDGGVSVLGTAAAIAFGLIIGIIFFLFTGNLKGILVFSIAGFLGSTADSYFGAIFERRKMIGNTIVNFLGSSVGAIAAYLLFLI